MKIFLSWSSERSKKIASIFNDWIPNVIQTIETFYSPEIPRGNRWLTDISGNLEKCNVGLLFVTPANIDSPWLNFEAGALSKHLDSTCVIPLLFDLEPTDLSGPIQQFQASKFSEKEVFNILHSINSQEKILSDKQLEKSFELWWPSLEQSISNSLSNEMNAENTIRTDREMIQETLQLSRDIHAHRKPILFNDDDVQLSDRIFHSHFKLISWLHSSECPIELSESKELQEFSNIIDIKEYSERYKSRQIIGVASKYFDQIKQDATSWKFEIKTKNDVIDGDMDQFSEIVAKKAIRHKKKNNNKNKS